MSIIGLAPNLEDIKATMRLFVEPDQIGEVRVLRGDDMSGFFFHHDEIDTAAKLAAKASDHATGVYIVMNRISRALHHRPRLVESGVLTKNDDIDQRRFILIDSDPDRETRTNATDSEKAAAGELRERIIERLKPLGFPEPVYCDSGNGFHLLFRIEEDNDESSKRLVQSFLETLKYAFNTDGAKVDISVHNASRITKLYGTPTRKGPNAPDRPHRRSTIQDAPSDGAAIVSRQLIENAIRELRATPVSQSANHFEQNRGNLSSVDWSESTPASDTETALAAISVLSPACGYEEWLKILMALHSVSESLLPDAVSWSQGSDKFVQGEVESKWKSFKSSGKQVGIGTLCHLADQTGRSWRPTRTEQSKSVTTTVQTSVDPLQQSLKELLADTSNRIRIGGDSARTLATLKTRVDELLASLETEPFPMMTSAELDAADLRIEYLVEGVLVKWQPCIFAAGKKSLKTTVSVDLTLSLASGSKFLGQFYVPRPVRVALMSGESGDATIQETARRIAKSKPWINLADYANAIWGFQLPRLGRPDTKATLRKFIEDNQLEVLIIDPAYLCLEIGGDAGNLFEVGSKLMDLTEVSHETGCTLVLIHHNRKAQRDAQFAPPELESIAWSGFQEWARQWILLGRREAYDPEKSGSHKLWLSVGGSAGHSGLWGMDIEEGSRGDVGGRRWDVSIDTASAVISDTIEANENQKEQRQQDKQQKQVQADAEKLLREYRRFPAGDTVKFYRELAGLNGTRTTAANEKLRSEGLIEVIEVVKNGRSYPGLRIVSNPSGLTGTASGLTGTNSACPDEIGEAGLLPLRGSPGPAHRDTDNSLFPMKTEFSPDDMKGRTV